MTTFNLEKSAKQLTDALSKAPPLAAVPLSDARKAVAAAQSAPIPMPDIDESWVTVPSNFGQVRVRLVRPQGVASPLPVIVYLHGGGWILGSSVTHDLLTRRLAVGANAVVAFVEYSLAPEAKYPTQNEQSYAAAQWIIQQGTSGGFDTTRIAVAGDSAGGNMATVLAIMAKQRGDVRFVHQSLYYPMTDANAEDSESENDVLRDQGEAYADKLRNAGVLTTSVRFNGTIHDFMRLNALRDSESTRAAISLAVAALRRAFGTE